MRRIFSPLACAGLALAISGCFSPRIAERNQWSSAYNRILYSDFHRNVPSSSQQAAMKKPLALAVVAAGQIAPPATLVDRLTGEKALFSSVTPLSHYVPAAVFDAEDTAAARASMEKLLQLARDLSAGYVLFVIDEYKIVRRASAWAMLDVLIVPGYLLPSHRLEAGGTISAVLIEVGSGRIVSAFSRDTAMARNASLFRCAGAQEALWEKMRQRVTASLADAVIDYLRYAGAPADE
ncbi:MAG: hypothetical protein NC924_08645 [Candidatus Omnitrophica bacterium]|nr:hypothetical protein [Candidatus Omnitrophota bacterium]